MEKKSGEIGNGDHLFDRFRGRKRQGDRSTCACATILRERPLFFEVVGNLICFEACEGLAVESGYFAGSAMETSFSYKRPGENLSFKNEVSSFKFFRSGIR